MRSLYLHHLVFDKWYIAFSIALLLPATSTADDGESYQKSMVVPAPRPRHPTLAVAMNRQAAASLEDLGYSLVPTRQAQGVIRRAQGGNVARCLDKTLIALGNAAGADMVVCPRVQSRPGGRAVRVRFARVSKRRVWSCVRPFEVEPGGSGQKEAAEAVAFCMDQLLSPAPKPVKKEKTPSRESRPKKKEWPRNHYLGVVALGVPAGRERFTGYTEEFRYSKHIDFDFSGGAGFYYERHKIRWLAFGFQFDYYSLGKHKRRKSQEVTDEESLVENDEILKIDRLNLFNIGVSVRFLYPGKLLEPYLKLAFGLTIAGAREGDTYPDVVVGSGFGANYQLRAGLMALFPYFGVFIDFGLLDALWFPNVEEAFELFDKAMVMDVCFVLNAGLAVVF